MFQKFFSDTSISRYIKSLLYCTPLPTYRTVRDGDYLIESCYYIYGTNVIKCTKSGPLKLLDSYFKFVCKEESIWELYIDSKFQQNLTLDELKEYGLAPIKCDTNDYIAVHLCNKGANGLTLDLSASIEFSFRESSLRQKAAAYMRNTTAVFESVKAYNFGEYYPQFTERFMSKYLYYDTDTHVNLGNYLRCIRDLKGINLMPFYNCYAGKYVPNLYLAPSGYISSEIDEYKLILVPIKFNQTYTIAIDCNSEVLMMPAVVVNDSVIMANKLDPNAGVAAPAMNKVVANTNLSYRTPIKFSVPNTSAPLQRHERNLSLLIQLPLANVSSVTVLEGDFTNKSKKVFSLEKENIDKLSNTELDELLLSELSLLRFNDKVSYPFSDRLVEYLLGNVISHDDDISNNIQLIQEYVGLKNRPELSTPGIWNNYLRAKLYKMMDLDDQVEHIDLNGYADKDVEKKARKLAAELISMYGG